MSKKPYEPKEWLKLFINVPYEKHLDLLIVLGIIYRSSEGEEALRNIDLSGDSVILARLMSNNESFAEAFEGIDVERLFYTYFSIEQYEEMLLEEWDLDFWAKTGLENHIFLTKWKDCFQSLKNKKKICQKEILQFIERVHLKEYLGQLIKV